MRDGFIKVAAATPEIRVADTVYNAGQIAGLIRRAQELGVKICVFPELCITGYTCGDLFLRGALVASAMEALKKLVEETSSIDMLCAVGLPVMAGGKLYNCAAVFCSGAILGFVPKTNIPNYGEFYEGRWFSAPAEDMNFAVETRPGEWADMGQQLFECPDVPGLTVGVEICEDLWAPDPPSRRLAQEGASVILNLSASDEVVGKAQYRRELVSGQSARLVCGYVYSDAGEGESTTDMVFRGHNIVAENGAILAEIRDGKGLAVSEIDLERLAYDRRRMNTYPAQSGAKGTLYASAFRLQVEKTDLTRRIERSPFVPSGERERGERCSDILDIQCCGLKKRLEHTGSRRMVVGVSGGLDSTLAMIVCARTAQMMGLPPESLMAVTMPCFGTTERTKSNAVRLSEKLGAELRTVDIGRSVMGHFQDIGHDPEDRNVVFENAQARERTQVIMDIANGCGGIQVGTGDLSELALGWATYNGDHMSMYGVNAGVPKTLVRYVVKWYADTCGDRELSEVLYDILDTPVSPELLPAQDGEISQKTEDLVGPYELHDFFLYHFVRWGFAPGKILRLALYAFGGEYSRETVLKWLRNFFRRFFAQQFKRSCLPDGPKVGSVSLSPRGDWRMPSDASAAVWMAELDGLE